MTSKTNRIGPWGLGSLSSVLSLPALTLAGLCAFTASAGAAPTVLYWTKTGGGTWATNQNNSFATTANGTANLAWTDGNVAEFTVAGGGGTVTTGNNAAITFAGIVFDAGAASYTLAAGNKGTTITGGITVNNAADTVGLNLAGTAGLAVSGTGVLTLTGANTYTGGTTVSSGTLLTGSAGALSGGNVTVSGGVLQIGNGTANSVTLTSAGTLSIASGATLRFNASTSSINVAGGGYAMVNGSVVDLNNAFNAVGVYNLFTGATGGNVDANILLQGFDTASYQGSFSNGVLTVVAVPEPSTYGLLGAGALAGVAMIRRRRKVAA